MNEDTDLLRRYAAEGAEDAFTALVQRHVNFVYGCALRRVGGDRQAAEDVVQRVFVTLARSANKLRTHPALAGWLHTATRNVAAQHVRGERRRRDRESVAVTMNALESETPPAWDKLGPLLDDALDTMSTPDREAVLLRYFQGCSYAEIGGRLRLAENAARMRVDRALDRLRAALERGGITSTAGGLAVALTQQGAIAAPAGLAVSAAASALASAAGGAGVLAFLGLGPVSASLAGAVLVTGAGLYWAEQRAQDRLRTEIAALQEQRAGLSALRAEHRQLATAAADVAQLRGADAEIRALSARVTEVRQAQTDRTRQAQAEIQARQAGRRRELERWLQEQDHLAQREVERLNKEGRQLVLEYKDFTARAENQEFDAAARQSAAAAAREVLPRIQAKQAEIKAYLAAERSRLSGAQEELQQLGVPADPSAKPAGTLVFRPTADPDARRGAAEVGRPGDPALGQGGVEPRLRLQP